jgi:hypothetical protein
MRELTMDELTMRELTLPELRLVSGGWTVFGAAATLGLTLAGIAGIVIGVIGAPIWAVVAGAVGIGVAATAGLVYAYDTYKDISESQQSTPVPQSCSPAAGSATIGSRHCTAYGFGTF